MSFEWYLLLFSDPDPDHKSCAPFLRYLSNGLLFMFEFSNTIKWEQGNPTVKHAFQSLCELVALIIRAECVNVFDLRKFNSSWAGGLINGVDYFLKSESHPWMKICCSSVECHLNWWFWMPHSLSGMLDQSSNLETFEPDKKTYSSDEKTLLVTKQFDSLWKKLTWRFDNVPKGIWSGWNFLCVYRQWLEKLQGFLESFWIWSPNSFYSLLPNSLSRYSTVTWLDSFKKLTNKLETRVRARYKPAVLNTNSKWILNYIVFVRYFL